ncbi:hypothetical protein PFBG_04651 [Plasmodium falciparum 7G8]|uniref:Uncharacterized protein n=1 Tax=Plasmodium falciparum (isolate 7G8) TaxID=57266 RepID=W7EWJ1_PLAF8|nr:hypothetical protein PFBG_04651 [Plasmodium falciparum 7G8]
MFLWRKKNRFIYLIHSLENATTYNYDKEEYDKKLKKKKNDIKNELNNITTDVSKMMNQLRCSSTFNDTYLYKAKNLLQSTYNVIK